MTKFREKDIFKSKTAFFKNVLVVLKIEKLRRIVLQIVLEFVLQCLSIFQLKHYCRKRPRGSSNE